MHHTCCTRYSDTFCLLWLWLLCTPPSLCLSFFFSCTCSGVTAQSLSLFLSLSFFSPSLSSAIPFLFFFDLDSFPLSLHLFSSSTWVSSSVLSPLILPCLFLFACLCSFISLPHLFFSPFIFSSWGLPPSLCLSLFSLSPCLFFSYSPSISTPFLKNNPS